MDQKYGFDQYVEVTQPRAGSLSQDAELLYYLCSGSDSKQIYVAESPHNSTQVTDFTNPVTFVSCSPTNDDIVFGKLDKGGSCQILHLMDSGPAKSAASTTEACQLGIDSSVSHRWGGWNPQGDHIAFVANRDDSEEFDLYVQQVEPEMSSPELICDDIGWVDLHGWSPSGESLLCVRSYSMRTQEILTVDVSTGSVTEITGLSAGTQFLHPNWVSGGRSILAITNKGSNTSYLANLDVQSKEITKLKDGGDWNFEILAVNNRSDKIAYTRNVDGYSELTVGTLQTPTDIGGTKEVKLLSGVAHGLSFDPSGRYLTLTFTNSKTPSQIYVVDAATGDARLWIKASTADIPRDTFVGSDLVSYESFDGLEVPGYLSIPDYPENERVPVIIDVHGGPETQRHPVFRVLNQYLLSNGYAIFEPNIRGSAGYGREYAAMDDVENRPDAIADVKAAADWLGNRESIDSDRIILTGKSYGGFVVLSAATSYPNRWAAAIDICGIANFVSYLNNIGESRRPLREEEYGSLKEHEELLRELSPIHDIENIECPLMIIHGENDRRVPVEEAYQVVQKARSEGVSVKSLFLPNEGHSFEQKETHHRIALEIDSFLRNHT
jgi:dipeptidyl aminopeptidase/acylaminoacyl peptidase